MSTYKQTNSQNYKNERPKQLASLVIVIIIKVWPEMKKNKQLRNFIQRFPQVTVHIKSILCQQVKHQKIHKHTYAACLLLAPFGTTAPPLAWVPLAPIPRFGSGNSINDRVIGKCNVAV